MIPLQHENPEGIGYSPADLDLATLQRGPEMVTHGQVPSMVQARHHAPDHSPSR